MGLLALREEIVPLTYDSSFHELFPTLLSEPSQIQYCPHLKIYFLLRRQQARLLCSELFVWSWGSMVRPPRSHPREPRSPEPWFTDRSRPSISGGGGIQKCCHKILTGGQTQTAKITYPHNFISFRVSATADLKVLENAKKI